MVQVNKHPYFKRNGADIHIEKAILLSRAVLGGDVRVETLDGEEILEVQLTAHGLQHTAHSTQLSAHSTCHTARSRQDTQYSQ